MTIISCFSFRFVSLLYTACAYCVSNECLQSQTHHAHTLTHARTKIETDTHSYASNSFLSPCRNQADNKLHDQSHMYWNAVCIKKNTRYLNMCTVNIVLRCAMAVSNQFWLSTLKHVIVEAAAVVSSVYIQLKHPFLGASGLNSKWIEMYLTASHSLASHSYEKMSSIFICCSVLFLFWRSQKQCRMNETHNSKYHMHSFGFRFVCFVL